jgi:prepilin peptidase CpaA
VQTIVIAVAIGILLAIAYSDARTRRIPNGLTAAIAVLGFVRLLLADDLAAAMHTLLASASILAATFVLFWWGVFGGGDAKLITAMALLVGSYELLDFLLIMSVCGGGLGLAILGREAFHAPRRHTSRQLAGPSQLHWAEPTPASRPTVPYGVAIACAGVLMLILRPVL